MDRPTPSVFDVVRLAVEVCDPDDVDPTLGRLEEQFEDADEPVTTVDNLEERLAIALEGADYEGEAPAVSVASAVVLYLAAHPGEVGSHPDPSGLIERAVAAQWHRTPPQDVADWVAGR
jgi:hypothetical protein